MCWYSPTSPGPCLPVRSHFTYNPPCTSFSSGSKIVSWFTVWSFVWLVWLALWLHLVSSKYHLLRETSLITLVKMSLTQFTPMAVIRTTHSIFLFLPFPGHVVRLFFLETLCLGGTRITGAPSNVTDFGQWIMNQKGYMFLPLQHYSDLFFS